MPHSVHTTPGTATPDTLSDTSIPFWNVNVREDQWTMQCPEWAKGVDERDRAIMSTPEEKYQLMWWSRVKEIIAMNRLDVLERRPTDLRRYYEYMYKLKGEYGSVLEFIQKHRLHWDSAIPRSTTPFAEASDYKILMNDWPYGLEPGISHLVVWTKFGFEEDPVTGDLTDSGRATINNFVQDTFCGQEGVDRRQLVWFKNWAALKSVHAVEHFHVMVHEASKEFLDRITDGDQPMSERV